MIEAVGTAQTWEWALQMVRRGGTVNLFGGCPRGTLVPVDPNSLHYSEITIKSTFHHTPRVYSGSAEIGVARRNPLQRFRERGNPAHRSAQNVRAHEASQRRNESRGDSVAARALTECFRPRRVLRRWPRSTMQIPAELEIARHAAASGCTVAEAERYTRWLATHHYENFNVVSWLLPRRLHQHFYNLYAYCRWADDLGDEVSDPAKALALLDEWDQELRDCYAGSAFASRVHRAARDDCRAAIFPSSRFPTC